MSAILNKIQRRANGKYDARDVVQEARLHHKTKEQRRAEALERKSRFLHVYDEIMQRHQRDFSVTAANFGQAYAKARLEEAIQSRVRAYKEVGLEAPPLHPKR